MTVFFNSKSQGVMKKCDLPLSDSVYYWGYRYPDFWGMPNARVLVGEWGSHGLPVDLSP
jgi:hypothetical protein